MTDARRATRRGCGWRQWEVGKDRLTVSRGDWWLRSGETWDQIPIDREVARLILAGLVLVPVLEGRVAELEEELMPDMGDAGWPSSAMGDLSLAVMAEVWDKDDDR